jgi:hypothetical protein
LGPRSTLEKHRFIFDDNIGGLWWPNDSGVFKLRGKFTLGDVPQEQRQQPTGPIEWEYPITELRVLPADLGDLTAWNWLAPRLSAFHESARGGGPREESVGVRKLRIFGEFLERFPDSSYAPAIRWETTSLLYDALQNWTYVEAHPEAIDLFDECLTFCLEKGGAYAEEFVEWHRDRGGNIYLDLAIKHERWTLVERMLEALDKRHPDDEGAALWRRARVAGVRESGEAARRILETIVEKFPGDRYAEASRVRIQDIDRGAWPPKPPDEEERLYKAALREGARSPEKGRRMLVDVLERFPDGRFSRQTRLTIDAIDDGSWPPKPPEPPATNTP